MFLFELFPFIMGKKILFHAKLNENNINFPKLYSAPNKSDHIKTVHLYYPVPNIKLFIDNDCSMIFFTIMNKNNQLIFNRYIFFSLIMVTFKIIKINNIAFLKKEKKLNVCLFDHFKEIYCGR
jgi:hypothetical protein